MMGYSSERLAIYGRTCSAHHHHHHRGPPDDSKLTSSGRLGGLHSHADVRAAFYMQMAQTGHRHEGRTRWRSACHRRPRREPESPLPVRSANHRHQLRDLFALIGLVPACNRVFDAMRHVILQYFFLDAPQRGPDRRDLRDDIDAVTVLVDHLGETADLAFDPAQPFLARCLDVFAHDPYIPLPGIGYKWPDGERDDRSRKRKRRWRFKEFRLWLRVQTDGGAPRGNGKIRL